VQLQSLTDDYLRCFRNGVPPRSQRKQMAAGSAAAASDIEPVLIE